MEPHFVQRNPQNTNFTSVIHDRTSFRAKGLPLTTQKRNVSSVFDARTSFSAQGLQWTPQNRSFTSVLADRSNFNFFAKGLPLQNGKRQEGKITYQTDSFQIARFSKASDSCCPWKWKSSCASQYTDLKHWAGPHWTHLKTVLDTSSNPEIKSITSDTVHEGIQHRSQ